MKVVIGLGANIGQAEQTFDSALAQIEQRIGKILKCSSRIQTAALLIPENPEFKQNDFLNAVVLVETDLNLEEVLSILQQIEIEHGRNKKNEIKWGPRILDLDILLCDSFSVETERLRAPHPEMHKRFFVLKPMMEICPDWKHPILQKTIRELYSELDQ